MRVLLTSVLAIVMSLPAAGLSADSFKVDPVHSFVIFRIKHMDVSYTYGRFNEPTGTLVVDDADPTKSSIDVTLQAEKVDTAHAGRDKHLRSEDFFSAREFPTIRFKSTSIKPVDSTIWEVTGDLTLHGQTRPVTLRLTRTGTGPGREPGSVLTGFEGTFEIKRSDFGMSKMIGPVGDDVRLTVSIEAIKS
jgi:polyisoprenoid-binding protein YceI